LVLPNSSDWQSRGTKTKVATMTSLLRFDGWQGQHGLQWQWPQWSGWQWQQWPKWQKMDKYCDDANIEDNNKDDNNNNSDQDKADGIDGDEDKWTTTMRDDNGGMMDGQQLAGYWQMLCF
jgi:hypothetical protein